jgi:ferredoxin-NADP reductase
MANPVRIQCSVTSVIHHDDAVATVTFKPLRRLPHFKPGQFLHVALDPYDPTLGFWPESRVFSIASTPFDADLTIAYGIKGAFTERMKAELTVGKEVWIRLPYGHFNLTAAPREEIVLVAGGTGITPFVSFISNELHRPSGLSLKLVYAVRRPELFIFADVLTKAKSQLNGFTLIAFSEEGPRCENPLTFDIGRLSLDRIWQAADDPMTATFYLSGPVNMISTFKAGLAEKGVDPGKIRIDEWE